MKSKIVKKTKTVKKPVKTVKKPVKKVKKQTRFFIYDKKGTVIFDQDVFKTKKECKVAILQAINGALLKDDYTSAMKYLDWEIR